MIVLDTNVISEAWKARPDSDVLAWLDAQNIETLYLSAVTVAELRYGIATMPEGKRRAFFHQRLEHETLRVFSGRILAFDLASSEAYAMLMAKAKAKGKAIAMGDGYIAATAAAHSFTVATRDTAPFDAAGIDVINPWTATP